MLFYNFSMEHMWLLLHEQFVEPLQILQYDATIGQCKSLCALPDIVGAFMPYQLLQEPSCPIDYCRSLGALSVIVRAFVSYRLMQELSCPTGRLWMFYGLSNLWDSSNSFGLTIRDRIYMFDVYAFQILCLLTELFNSLSQLFLLQIQIGQDPQLPHEISSHSSISELDALLT